MAESAPEQAEAAEQPQAAAGGGGAVDLGRRFQILPGQPIPELDSPKAKAFRAMDRESPSSATFALVATSNLPIREDVLGATRGIDTTAQLLLLEFGVVPWPPLRRRCMAMVYEQPLGGRVMPVVSAKQRPMDDNRLTATVIEPVTRAIREFAHRGVTHRSIRPDNLFYADEEMTRAVLGEGASAPPGYSQGAVFETIESGMCSAPGRGPGTIGDDLYSLGVTIITLLLGANPLAHLSDPEIIRLKLERGSYNALVGEERIGLNMMEPLRGLICDNPHERWGLEQLDLWLSGRRLSPIQHRPAKRAPRPFSFAGEAILTYRGLARALAENWDLALKPIREGQVETWIRRAFEDTSLADAIGIAARSSNLGAGDRRAGEDLLITRVCSLLDPRAPIRYKTLAAMPEGLGSWGASAFRGEGGDIQLFGEVIAREAFRQWFDAQTEYNPSNVVMSKTLGTIRTYMQQNGPGYGIERALYELNPSLPCLSPLIEAYHVVSVKDLLPALNDVAKNADTSSWPFDRHIAAFIACRFEDEVDNQLGVLADDKSDQKSLAMLSLLAMIQWRFGPDSLHGLTSWVGGLVAPAMEIYHSRSHRKKLEEDIPRVVRRGSLPELFNLLDNADERQKDDEGFHTAVHSYGLAESEILEIELGGAARTETAIIIGQQAAAFVSTLVALFTISILFLINAF